MKKCIAFYIIFILYSCGSGLEYDGPDSRTYTYILRNNTNVQLLIKSDQEFTELVQDGGKFQCEIVAEDGYGGALCSLELEIRIPNSNRGYRCFGLASDIEGLCFVEDFRVFTISEGTIFTEINTRTYEYVLTPDLLDNAFELPE
ncbi:hypothetical protein AB1A65_01120 [Muricauda sp. ANG21]|uniref:hypothetical protein n=1 Tax=Allomuricauda sp. ANG21 TaxID=3042468 RepID=UPI003451483E